MTATIYRPTAPPASILREIVCIDELQRFRACQAVCASIWAVGLNSCRSSWERDAWMLRYAAHLDELSAAWHREN